MTATVTLSKTTRRERDTGIKWEGERSMRGYFTVNLYVVPISTPRFPVRVLALLRPPIAKLLPNTQTEAVGFRDDLAFWNWLLTAAGFA